MTGEQVGPFGDESLEDVLRAAFGEEPREDESVLDAIERASGAPSRVLLRDPPDEASPVLRLHGDDSRETIQDDRRYQVIGEIARGGMGVVFKGRDRDLGRPVALKVLRPERLSDADVVRRFVEEAQIGGQLQHPGIVPVYGLGLGSYDRPYFAMKLVKGETLAARLMARADPTVDRRRLLGVFEQIALTVSYAHARGVIHRDLKPSNVLLGPYGEVLVLDWGLAKVLDHEEPDASPTHTVIETVRTATEGSASLAGSVMGTPACMPPEQALGRVTELDERSDVFALGAILTEILTGAPPYVGDTNDQLVQAMRAELSDAHARLADCGAEETIVDLARRCLSPVPKDRPGNAGEVARELARRLEEMEARARREELGSAKARAASAEERERERRARRQAVRERRSRVRTLVLASSVLLAVGLGVGGYAWTSIADRGRREAAATAVAEALEEVARHESDRIWPNAVAAARKAVNIAESQEADAAVIERTRETLARLRVVERAAAEAARIEREDEALVQRLEEIRLSWFDRWDARQADVDVAEAFRSVGLDPDRMPSAEIAAFLRGRRRPADLAAALLAWGWLRRNHPDLGDGERMEKAAELAFPDWAKHREEIEAAKGDDARLRAIADSIDEGDLPARRAYGLSLMLERAGSPAAAVSLRRRAALHHPDDLWLHFQLSLDDWYSDTTRAARHVSAALALRPGNGLLLENLGMALIAIGRSEEGLALHEMALEADTRPGYALALLARAHFGLENYEASAATARGAQDDGGGPTWTRALQGAAKAGLGQYQEALEICRAESRRAHDSPVVEKYLAWVLERAGHHDDALAIYRRQAKSGGPDQSRRLFNLGAALVAAGGPFEEAERVARRVAELAPASAQSHLLLALVLGNRGRFEEAERAARRAIALNPGLSWAWNGLGCALSGRGFLEEAEEAFRHSLRLRPDEAMVLSNLAGIRFSRGEPEEAEAMARRAVKLAPKLTDAQCQLGWILLEQDRFDEAERSLSRALLENPRNAAAEGNLGNLRHRQGPGRWRDAVKSLRRAIDLAPEAVIHRTRLLWTLWEMGEHDAALEAARECVAKLPENSEVRVWLGVALEGEGKLAEAEREFRRALELDPSNAWAPRNLGMLLTVQARLEEAEEAWRWALARDPDMAEAHANLGLVLGYQYRSEVALPHHRRALELDPEIPNIRRNLGFALLALGRREEAEAAFHDAIASGDTSAWTGIGDLHLMSGRLGQAEAAYRKSLVASVEDAGGFTRLLRVLAETGRMEEALPVARERVKGDPSPPALLDLATVLVHLGRCGEALRVAERIEGPERLTPVSRANLGNIHYICGELSKALELWSAAAKTAPRFADIHGCVGTVLWRLGDRKKARKSWARGKAQLLLDIERGLWNEAAYRSLAWHLLGDPVPDRRDPSAALAYAEKAASLSPESRSGRMTLGIAEYRAGQHVRAARTLARFRTDSDHGGMMARLFLAMALFHEGDRSGARDTLKLTVARIDAAWPKDPDLADFRAEAEALMEGGE